ncbi:YeeE/YedE family protein [Rhodoplanes sp. Z2-YC6860]|uniref:YeeE/YedE family protein n=1 Tax=Rhodoplanes sp. Z2-YC6860 TaxID=674703 RepID=UPI00078C4754|nr:YeeE/YedE thiosulfate transporter family protein [Rhodoplanes sp. Z2-YC6860]AMN40399.1 YeeE/YedE family protein [Rhodoplanes sp. Z2-YC6860]
MASFDPISALAGGALVGLASAMLMMLIGRIAGISGILGGGLTLVPGDKLWRLAFVAGLVLAPTVSGLLGHPMPEPQMPDGYLMVIAAGLLVGFGARLGGGCTSGHGVCGIARFSARSIAATAIFMSTAVVVVAVMRHGFGG